MTYLESAIDELRRYRKLAERAMLQLRNDEDLHWTPDAESNSIAILVRHLAGNMISRWTDFLTSDGEKPSRQRDAEFVDDAASREQLLALWNRGWTCLFDALEPLRDEDLQKTVYVRGEALTVVQAINRQVAHYASHVGQIVWIAKHRESGNWKSLSIPRKIAT
jgi:hypothetical protein